MIPVAPRGRIFLKFGTDLGTHTGLLFAKFQKNSSTGSFFMDDSNAKNGHFWPKIAIFALESPIKIEPVQILAQNFAES